MWPKLYVFPNAAATKFEFGCHGNKDKNGTFFKYQQNTLNHFKYDYRDFKVSKTVIFKILSYILDEIWVLEVDQ